MPSKGKLEQVTFSSHRNRPITYLPRRELLHDLIWPHKYHSSDATGQEQQRGQRVRVVQSHSGLVSCRLNHHTCYKGSNETGQRRETHDDTLDSPAILFWRHIQHDSCQQGDGSPCCGCKDEERNCSQR